MEQLGQEKPCRGLGCYPRFRLFVKAAVTLFVVLCCLVVAAMVWRFGYSLGKSEFEAQLFGWLGVLATVLKILLPFWVFAMGRKIYALLAQDDWQLRHGLSFVFRTLGVLASIPVWFLWTSLSLTASLGFAAIQRAETVPTLQQVPEPPFAKWQKLSQERKKLLARKDKTVSDSIVASARTTEEAPSEMVTILRPERTAYFLMMFLTLGCELVSAFGLFLLFGNKRLKGCVLESPKN